MSNTQGDEQATVPMPPETEARLTARTDPRPDTGQRTCLLVLGMHRSGTSALTRVLSLMGAALPVNIQGPGLGNETGHWEPKRLVLLHDQMLAEAGTSWNDWRKLDLAAQLPEGRLAHYGSEIRRVIEEDYGDATLFVLKDPRICRFVPLYRDVLDGMGVEFCPILSWRNPLAVAASLAARDQIAVAQSQLYWLRHILDAEYATRDVWRAVVSYEALLADWRDSVKALSEQIALAWPVAIDHAASEIDGFLSVEHQHHAASKRDLLASGQTLDWVRDTYAAFERIAADPAASSVLDHIRSEFDMMAGVHDSALGAHRHSLGHANAMLAAAQSEIERSTVDVETARTEAERSKAELENARADTEQAKAEAEAARGEVERAKADIEAARADGERAKADIEAARADAERAKADIEAARADAERAKADIEAARAEAERAKAELETVGAEAERARAEVEALRWIRDEHDRMKANADQFARDRDQALQQLAMSQTQRGYVESRLQHLKQFRLVRAANAIDQVGKRLRGWPVKFHPISDLRQEADVGRGSTWTMTGIDPAFHIELNGVRLPPGHYGLFGCSTQQTPDLDRPCLYVDSGQGFSEAEKIQLCFSQARDKWNAAFTLPKGAIGLRFDPSIAPGQLQLSDVRLRRRFRIEHYARFAIRAARTRLATKTGIRRTFQLVTHSLRRGGIKGLMRDVQVAALSEKQTPARDYAAWVKLYDTITADDRSRMRRASEAFSHKPLISIVMPTYNTPAELLREAIESVLDQTYGNWELCIADDCSKDAHVHRILAEYQRRDPRIKVVLRPENGHIAKASNSALDLATGEYVALLDHDDTLAPHALFCVVDAINRHPDAKLIYSDEDKIDLAGRRHDPYFKSDWNPDLFLSHNLITHLGVYHRATIEAIGSFRTGFDGAQDYDLALRFTAAIKPEQIVHIPHVLYHWRVMPGSTAASADEKPYAMLAGERALNDHLQQREIKARAELIGLGFRIHYELPKPPPRVSIIIPARNAEALVRQCIGSIRQLTTYPNYEILLIDNGSDDPGALAYFAELSRNGVTVIRDDSPFNYSALNNRAVYRSSGEVVVLLNNDIEVITKAWLEEMVSLAVQPGVGAVGAKLYYPNGTIQHGGVILGIGGVAGHSHKGLHRASGGYFSRAALTQSLSAVTAACLAVRKEHYLAVGGLDEENLKVAFNDVDFCLKLRSAGLRNVWTPFAELYHHESATRGSDQTPEKRERFASEVKVMRSRWASVLDNDPSYSPNLTLDTEDFAYAFPPRVAKPWKR